jgi:hypothetical protein
MTRQVSLSVNDAPISLDYFVQAFIDHTVGGMVEALEGTGQIKNLSLSVDGDRVTIELNGTSVSINPFVAKIIRGTTIGMVSSLKGIHEIKRLQISIAR